MYPGLRWPKCRIQQSLLLNFMLLVVAQPPGLSWSLCKAPLPLRDSMAPTKLVKSLQTSPPDSWGVTSSGKKCMWNFTQYSCFYSFFFWFYKIKMLDLLLCRFQRWPGALLESEVLLAIDYCSSTECSNWTSNEQFSLESLQTYFIVVIPYFSYLFVPKPLQFEFVLHLWHGAPWPYYQAVIMQ